MYLQNSEININTLTPHADNVSLRRESVFMHAVFCPSHTLLEYLNAFAAAFFGHSCAAPSAERKFSAQSAHFTASQRIKSALALKNFTFKSCSDTVASSSSSDTGGDVAPMRKPAPCGAPCGIMSHVSYDSQRHGNVAGVSKFYIQFFCIDFVCRL